MRFLKFLAVSILFIGCGQPAKEVNTPPNLLAAQFENLVNAEYKSGRFDGSLAVRHQGQLMFSKSIGLASREWKIPLRKNHRFDIASVNKSFIAALTLKAVELGHFDLQDTLNEVLIGLELKGGFDPNITIHQMLSHLSGMNDYGGIDERLQQDNFLKFKRQRFTNEEYLYFLSEVPMVGNPGQQFYYSNFAYHVLCVILETSFGQSFEDILQQHIAKPLDLKNTFASSLNETIKPKLVKGYNYDASQSTWLTNDFIDLTLGRRIFSTAEDLALWTEAIGKSNLLSESSWKAMLTNHVRMLDSELSYGYGWVIHDLKGDYRMGKLPTKKPYIIHGGNTGGYKAITVNINQGEWVFSALSNIGGRFDEIGFAKKVTTLINDYEN